MWLQGKRRQVRGSITLLGNGGVMEVEFDEGCGCLTLTAGLFWSICLPHVGHTWHFRLIIIRMFSSRASLTLSPFCNALLRPGDSLQCCSFLLVNIQFFFSKYILFNIDFCSVWESHFNMFWLFLFRMVVLDWTFWIFIMEMCI